MRHWIGFILCVGLGASLAGCRSQSEPPLVAPAVAVPEVFSMSGEEVLPEKWWLSLHDPALNALIEEALTGNFSLQTSWDRLTQAEQIAVKSGAALLPRVAYQADVTRTRREPGLPDQYSTNVSAGIVASYEVDLWNKVRAGQEASLFDVRAREQDLASAAVTLSVSVSKTWYQLAESTLQVALIEAQLVRNQNVLEILRIQFRNGKAGAPDVLRQRQLVESSGGQLIQAEEQVKLLQHRLCVLLGRSPDQAWADESLALIDLPPLPATGIPAKLIQKRPDVASAFYSIHAADRRTAVAIADKYPSINLTGILTTSESRIEDLFDDWLASLAGSLAGPVFDAGLREAEAQRTRAVLSQAIHSYKQAVLLSLQEVEDALVQESAQRDYMTNLGTQLEWAQKAYESLRQRFLYGRLDYLRVLESLESQQRLERSQLTARRFLIDRRIDLCRALAGAWDMERPEISSLAQ